ncbi:MAG TPA: hypothetical protein VIX20_18730 [Ktedonobacteraceae bacterium]
MSNTSPQHLAGNTGAIFAQLNQHDVEEFYIGYQYWNLQHQIEALQIRLDDFRKQIIVNTERIQEAQPTAIELATLARLQSNGVSNVDLLDRMLERGESWLDRTMQRLDYFEQLDDFIRDNYTQWCQHALEGAYDWIDSVLDGNATSIPSTATTSATTQDIKGEGLLEATEELFLQKISNDEDESLMQAITMKRPSITVADLEEAVPSPEDTRVTPEVSPTPENTPPVIEEAKPVDTTPVTNLPTEEVTVLGHEAVEVVPISEEVLPLESNNTSDITSTQENANLVIEQSPIHEDITPESNEDTKTSIIEEAPHTEYAASEEPLSVESSSTSTTEHPPLQEPVEITPAKTSSSSTTESPPAHVSSKRPNFMKRFFGKIWGS